MPPSEQDQQEHYGTALRLVHPDTIFWSAMRRALLTMADAIKARYL